MEKRMRSIVIALIGLAVVAGGAGHGVAQPATAPAERLFREGKRLMSEGNIAEGCQAFEGSYRKDPAVSTLLNLADCREKNHQYASAWAHFVEAARMSRGRPEHAGFYKTASARAASLEPRLSYLTINVPAEAVIEGLTITRNGVAVDEAEWNRSIPVDGGQYKIEGNAPAHEPWSTTVTVGAAKDRQAVTLPRFHPAPGDRSQDTEHPDAPSRLHRSRKGAIAGWTLTGTGVVGLAAGGAMLVSAAGLEDDARKEDRETARIALRDKASTRRTVGYVVGGISVAAATAGIVTLLINRPSVGGRDVALFVSPTGIDIVGRF